MVHDSSRQFQECHQKSYRFPPLTCPANPFFGHERFLRRTDLRSSRKSPWSLERSGRTVGTRATRRCFENWGFFESWSLFIPLYCNKVLRVLQKHLVLTYASISIFQVDCIISKVRFCKNSPPRRPVSAGLSQLSDLEERVSQKHVELLNRFEDSIGPWFSLQKSSNASPPSDGKNWPYSWWNSFSLLSFYEFVKRKEGWRKLWLTGHTQPNPPTCWDLPQVHEQNLRKTCFKTCDLPELGYVDEGFNEVFRISRADLMCRSFVDPSLPRMEYWLIVTDRNRPQRFIDWS